MPVGNRSEAGDLDNQVVDGKPQPTQRRNQTYRQGGIYDTAIFMYRKPVQDNVIDYYLLWERRYGPLHTRFHQFYQMDLQLLIVLQGKQGQRHMEGDRLAWGTSKYVGTEGQGKCYSGVGSFKVRRGRATCRVLAQRGELQGTQGQRHMVEGVSLAWGASRTKQTPRGQRILGGFSRSP